MGSALSRVKKDPEILKCLSDRQYRFVFEYVIDYVGTRAAIDAGYSPKTAQVKASQLLKIPKVRRAIQYLQQETIDTLKLKREDVLLQLLYCITRSLDDFCDEEGKLITDINKLSERAKCAVDGVKQEVRYEHDREGKIENTVIKNELKLVPKASAIDMGMKHFGEYKGDGTNQNAKPIDWDALSKDQSDLPDSIEQRLLEEE